MPMTLLAGTVDNGYKIDNWKYEAHVTKDNVWNIKETMTVTYLSERHGIFRYIPRNFYISHVTNGGTAEYKYHAVISDVNVKSYKFIKEEDNEDQSNLIIKIGDKDKLVTGTHTYEISYTITVPDDRFEASDYIYTCLLGDGVNTTIGKFEFALHFDKPLPAETEHTLRMFSGKWTSTGNDLHIEFKSTKNSISGSAVDIEPFNAITIRAELKNGYWEEPYTVGCSTFYIFFIISVVLFLVIMYYFVRNRRRKPLTVIEYSAPDDISSAEVGVIIDDSVDLSDLTSLIVWFASKGYLKIREIEGIKHIFSKDEIDIELTKLKPLPKDAPDYQKKFWNVFFKDTDTVLLSKLGKRNAAITEALNALQKHFTGERSLQKTNYVCLLLIFAFFVTGSIAINGASSVSVFDDTLAPCTLIIWTIPAFITAITRMYLSRYDMIRSLSSRLRQYGIIIALGLMSVGLFAQGIYEENNSYISREVLTGIIVAGWIIALLAGRVMKDSQYRLEKMSLLLGFREFIEKSELPMLKAQVDETPSYFYDVLPYAMVFGLTNKWVKAFKGIDIHTPSWYEGTGNAMTSYMIADHLSNAVSQHINSTIQASSHAPSSSSGGHAGGGCGGGGCGSW